MGRLHQQQISKRRAIRWCGIDTEARKQAVSLRKVEAVTVKLLEVQKPAQFAGFTRRSDANLAIFCVLMRF